MCTLTEYIIINSKLYIIQIQKSYYFNRILNYIPHNHTLEIS